MKLFLWFTMSMCNFFCIGSAQSSTLQTYFDTRHYLSFLAIVTEIWLYVYKVWSSKSDGASHMHFSGSVILRESRIVVVVVVEQSLGMIG